MHPAEDAFGRWFADSKVVDASGAPLVVYHGTASDFSRFDSGRGAIYFTSDPAIGNSPGKAVLADAGRNRQHVT